MLNKTEQPLLSLSVEIITTPMKCESKSLFSFKQMHSKISFTKSWLFYSGFSVLTHWGRVTHICVSKLTIIGSDNGLAPDRRQAIIWTNAGLLLIGPLGTNFSEILIEILAFSFKKTRLKVSSAKRRPFCLGLNVLTHSGWVTRICISELDQHWFRQWHVTCLAPSHYLTNADLLSSIS